MVPAQGPARIHQPMGALLISMATGRTDPVRASQMQAIGRSVICVFGALPNVGGAKTIRR